MTSSRDLRSDALAIWHAGVAAVDSERLVREQVQVEGDLLLVGDDEFQLNDWRRIVVVGAGKAGAGMAAGLEQTLGRQLARQKQLTGWVNVPADCVRPMQFITLHAARPAGRNEPTEAGVQGTRRILELLHSATSDDLCVVLISGGGSALLPAPVEGISLADKQAVTKHLSSAGANIEELNTVRKQLSSIKGGGLARTCRAGRLITLIISDVLGDPLDVIASGPTVPNSTTAADALRILDRFDSRHAGIAPAVFAYLEKAIRTDRAAEPFPCPVTNLVIGNNATAVDAAGIEAERRGYSHAMVSATQLEGAAESIGEHHAEMAWRMRTEPGPDCLITGGEPTVQLADSKIRGKGGRNQQLVLAALQRLLTRHQSAKDSHQPPPHSNPLDGIVLLSGGTDGEDGPTDAAGAMIDSRLIDEMLRRGLDPVDYLRRNDAYHFFEPLDGLLKTGPTHTNVCDLRVIVTKSTDKS